MTSPEPTASPARRSSWQNRTSTPVMPGSGTGGDLLQVVPDQVEVVMVLHHGAEGVLGKLRAEFGAAEQVQGAGPVDGLGHAGRLGEVELAQPMHRGDHLAGERL